MAQHTPGPYEVGEKDARGDYRIYAGQGEGMCVVAVVTGEERHLPSGLPDGVPEGPANARLFAAAPDVLSALEGIVEAAAARYDEYGDGEREPALLAARAALRRARGDPPLIEDILAAFDARRWSHGSAGSRYADLTRGRFIARPNEHGSVTVYRLVKGDEKKVVVLWTRGEAEQWLKEEDSE